MEVISLLVPTDRAGWIIGKAGTGLKQVRDLCNCTVVVEQDSDPTGMRRTELSGPSLEQLANGFQQVIFRAFQQEPTCSVTLRIPEEKAGLVAGKGGENMKRVRDACGVKVTLERKPVIVPATGVHERLVVMTGQVRNMKQALCIALGGVKSDFGGFGVQAHMVQPYSMPFANQQIVGMTQAAFINAQPVNQQIAGLTQVRPPSNDKDVIQAHMVIPDSCAGAILGKEGTGLKNTAANSGCRIVITKRDGSSDRRVIFNGEHNQCASAQMFVHAQYVEAAKQLGKEVSSVTVIYFVPKDAVGAVIGKEAVSLKAIREETGTSVTLYREEVEGQRPAAISGAIQDVLNAQRLILEKVKSAPPPLPRGDEEGGMKRQLPAIITSSGGNMSLPKRPRMDQHGQQQLTKLLVPARAAGAVIGKQGSGLKQLRESYGVHIELLQQGQAPQWPNDRIVILKGPAPSRLAALDAVLKIAFQMDQDATLKMLVATSSAGFLIGKQGSGLKAIREQCGINAKVERDEIMGERLVTAQGNVGAICAVASVVVSVLEKTSQLGGTGEMQDEEHWDDQVAESQGAEQWAAVPYDPWPRT